MFSETAINISSALCRYKNRLSNAVALRHVVNADQQIIILQIAY